MVYAKLFGVINHDDAVTHDDTHQRDNAQRAGYAHFLPHDKHTRGCAQQRKQQRQHDNHRHANVFEVEQQDGEYHHDRNNQSAINLRLGFQVFFPLSAHSHRHSLRQLNLIYLVNHLVGNVVEVQTAFGVGHNRHRTDAVTVVNGGVSPVGRHLSNLS